MIFILIGASLLPVWSDAELFGAESPLEALAAYLRDKNLTSETLEELYSCTTLDEMLRQSLKSLNNLEESLVSSRKRTRIAGLLPEVSIWGKYKNDEKLYLYQKNNIAVGKDYVTVGPDDNNTTYGDLTSYEIGGKISFNMSKLLYNSDMIRFEEQEQKLYFLRIDMVDRLSNIYFFAAMLRAVDELKIDIPAEKRILFEVMNKKNLGWLKAHAGFDLNSCREDKNE